MIDSNSQFFAILTAVGEAKQANATALGIPWTFKEMGVGDANNTDPIPSRTQTRLVNEWRRAPVNQVRTDPANANIIITEQVIPSDIGGRWIREIALYDADGDMVAVANCAPSFKPLLAQGTGKTQIIRMNFIVANTAQIVLKIDPAVVLATREYVDTSIVEALAKMDFKNSALVATTANIVLNGIQTVDGELLPAGAVVLVKNQTVAKDNGLYDVSLTGGWKRSKNADSSLEVTPGLFVSVEKGTVNGDSVWQLVTDGPIVLGATDLAFEMAVGRTGVSAGSYANVTVDKYGRVIAGTNPTTLAGYGITDTYTKPEVDSIVAQASALPVGTMVAFPVNKVAPGFLEIDGSVKSIATYPDLAAFLGGAFNLGNEGAGNFRLPESRGEFFRGWDHGRGIDTGRAIGSWQVGTYAPGDGDGQNLPIPNLNNVDHMRVLGIEYDKAPWVPESITVQVTAAAASGAPMDGVQTPGTASAGVDFGRSRPRNIAVMWCIKAWNAPINQGNIDIAALVLEMQKQKPMVRGQQIFSVPGTASFIVPADAKADSVFDVEVWGGGASGSGGGVSGAAGGGGGPGGYSFKSITGLVAGAAITVTVGAGGASVVSSAAGATGGTSSFGGYCSATGGKGIAVPAGGSAPGGLGGSGVGGDLNLTGNPGDPSEYTVGGDGGAAPRGGGGGQGGFGAVGSPGFQPGGGGGGGDGPGLASGAGGAGMVMVRWR